MELPHIKNENLPEELKEILGDSDANFDPLFDEEFAVDFPIDSQTFVNQKIASARRMILHRKYVEEMQMLYKKYESGKISAEEAERLMKEATQRKNDY